jgi:hypothetical protein
LVYCSGFTNHYINAYACVADYFLKQGGKERGWAAALLTGKAVFKQMRRLKLPVSQIFYSMAAPVIPSACTKISMFRRGQVQAYALQVINMYR